MLTHSHTKNPHPIDIKLNHFWNKQVREAKFLRITIDDKLQWKSHIQELNNNFSKITGILHQIRKSCTNECLKWIYNSLEYSRLLYCSFTSMCKGNTFKIYIDKLFINQKKLLKIIPGCDRFQHTAPIFCELKL